VSASTEQHRPLISVCIPTHHGRADTLAVLIEDLAEQARELPGMVEICISDNASDDGTAEMVAGLANRASCRVQYRRHERDLGLVANLLAAVELAHGEYCWLMGSDDVMERGALGRSIELMGAMPDMTGYLVGAVYVDADDPRKRSRQLPRAFHPPGATSRRIDDLDAIYDECGNSWILLSWNIVARAAWNAAVERHRDLVLANPIYPQIVVLAMMARERPQWGWLAEPLVRQRNALTFLFERGDVPLADCWSELITGISKVWSGVFGGRGRRWRRRMRKVAEVWGSAEDVRATKLYETPSPRSQIRLTRTLLVAFWPVGGYWRDVIWASLMPVWLTRARHGSVKGWLARKPKLHVGQLDVSGDLPRDLHAGGVAIASVAVRNLGRRTVPATGPDAVTIAQRWWSLEGLPLQPSMFGTNELAALPRPIARGIRRGRSVSTEIPLYAPIAPGSYRLEIVANQPGRWLDEAGVAAPLTVTVDVTADGCDSG
jgi:hypothetical protein